MRGRILDAAEGLFSKNGYDETAVSDIVREMGVAQGTFYYYFASKEDCLDALVERLLDVERDVLEEVVDRSDSTAPEKLLAAYDLRIRRVEHRVMDYLHLEENAKLHYKMSRKRFHEFLPLVTRLVEEGVEDGQFRTDHPEATAAGVLLLNEMVEMLDRTPESFGIRPDIIGPLQEQMEMLLGAEPGTLEGFADL